jgi:hypothetical protein
MSYAPIRIGIFATAVVTAAALLLSGCAAPTPALSAAREHRIETPLDAEEHEAIALDHERRAAADASAAQRHAGFAALYRRNKSSRGAQEAHEPLAKHCDAVAQTYRQASEQKLGTARLHRELAREATMQD